ncbi:MAG: hypothetical protein ABR570_17365 [Burkholderiales bacterium]
MSFMRSMEQGSLQRRARPDNHGRHGVDFYRSDNAGICASQTARVSLRSPRSSQARRKKMNAAFLSRTLSLIPDRVSRMQTGTLFNPTAAGGCAHPERLAHLARFLDWLGPLREVTNDDLHTFGLLTPYAKPSIEEEADVDIEPGATPAPQPQLEGALP